MDQGCRRLIVKFQSWGQMLSSSSVFSVLYHGLFCKSAKNNQHRMASPCYLAVCLVCWWDASIPAPWVSWTTNPSFFISRAVLLQCGFCVCSRTAGSRVLHTLFVLMRPLVHPWTDRCAWPMHTTPGLVLYCIISLKLQIIFQLFLLWAAVCHERFNCWDFFFVLYFCWWPLNY